MEAHLLSKIFFSVPEKTQCCSLCVCFNRSTHHEDGIVYATEKEAESNEGKFDGKLQNEKLNYYPNLITLKTILSLPNSSTFQTLFAPEPA